MQNTKHAEAPWLARRDEEGGHFVTGGGTVIAYMVGPEERREANANLMATALALLELVAQYRSDLLHYPAPDSIERRVKAIDAVLVKAGAK